MNKFMTHYEHQRLPGLEFGPSRTKQAAARLCDINCIMERASRTGCMPIASRVGHYLDVSGVLDYQFSLERVREADALFAALPAVVRRRFGNDPAQMLAFVSDEKNREEAVKLGLIEKPVVESVNVGEAPVNGGEEVKNES